MNRIALGRFWGLVRGGEDVLSVRVQATHFGRDAPAAVRRRGRAGADTVASPHGRGASVNRVQLFATPWFVASQVPLSMGLPR